MGLSTKLTAAISYHLTGAPDLGNAEAKYDGHAAIALASGTGASLADKVFSDRRNLGSGANESLDLSGALVDPIGVACVFAKVKGIIIKSLPANTTNLTVKPAASSGWLGPFGAAAHALTIPPGGSIALFAPVNGWAVTAEDNDLFNIANAAGAAANYEIIIVGTSA